MDASRDQQLPEGPDPAAPAAGGPTDLHLCPECGSGLVQPTEWVPVDMCHWRIELRCPECEWHRAGTYEQAVLDEFEGVLDAGIDAMVDGLRRLQRSNMEAEIERFSIALAHDLILPEDF